MLIALFFCALLMHVGMGIYDAMKLCKADVSTVCLGLAASMGAFLLASGTKGKRFCMPNGKVMIHQPLGTAGGKVSVHYPPLYEDITLEFLPPKVANAWKSLESHASIPNIKFERRNVLES